MGVIVPQGFAQCVLKLSHEGDAELMVSTIGVVPLGATVPEDIATVVYNAATHADGPMVASRINDEYTFVGVTAFYRDSTGFLVFEHDDPVEGTQSGQPLPSNCALLIRKLTAVGGRKNKGRMYLPAYFGAETTVDGNGNITSNIASLRAVWDEFIEHLADGGGVAPRLFHSDGSAATVITGLFVESKIATQRRRMR